jgi:hypothetical protein
VALFAPLSVAHHPRSRAFRAASFYTSLPLHLVLKNKQPVTMEDPT